ncbi:hypothetical protein I41_39150 [Lacipirellula limnantheis]|uniref:Uncharacterized protein n=1 Tax=Lacipirellula limnantheis TaxID=2528024 RepID=A0A517U260_9BACT|nr:hypothetical protein I41_39150 [Lacipirellula limnantheis]
MVSLLAAFNQWRGGDPAHSEQQTQLMLFTYIMLMIRPSEGAEDVPLAARMCFWPTIAGQTFPAAPRQQNSERGVKSRRTLASAP